MTTSSQWNQWAERTAANHQWNIWAEQEAARLNTSEQPPAKTWGELCQREAARLESGLEVA